MSDFRLSLAGAMALLSTAAYGQAAPLAPVEQTSLSKDAFSTGTLDRGSGALSGDLWRGAEAGQLRTLLTMAPARPSSPAIGAALRRVLLTSGEAPAGATAALGGAKLKALVRAGFFEEARQIESLSSGADADPASIEALAVADILSGDISAACSKGRRITTSLDNTFWVRLRVVCYASANELDAAELALGILRENGRLTDMDAELLGPLAAGGRLKAPVSLKDAVQYAALKAMGLSLGPGLLDQADGGVVIAVARDESADWTSRIAAARRAAAMGVMSAADLKALYRAAPAEAVAAYAAIEGMSAPELMRDRAGLIAREIAASSGFDEFYASSVLYADEIRDLEGALLPADEAGTLGLSRLAIGDIVGAERWLASSGNEIARGVPEEQLMRFIDLVSALGAVEPAAAQRIAASANITLTPPATPDAPASASSPADLAPLVSAAIEAARLGGAGAAALAALAASDAAASGDPIAMAIVGPSLRAAGLSEIVRRLAAEAAIRGLYPARSGGAGAPAAVTPASAPAGLEPRLKPKRSA